MVHFHPMSSENLLISHNSCLAVRSRVRLWLSFPLSQTSWEIEIKSGMDFRFSADWKHFFSIFQSKGKSFEVFFPLDSSKQWKRSKQFHVEASRTVVINYVDFIEFSSSHLISRLLSHRLYFLLLRRLRESITSLLFIVTEFQRTKTRVIKTVLKGMEWIVAQCIEEFRASLQWIKYWSFSIQRIIEFVHLLTFCITRSYLVGNSFE